MTRRRFAVAVVLVLVVAVGAYVWLRPRPQPRRDMNALAERYVRLVLAVGLHDADYVDAYYGPPEWRTEAEHAKVPLPEIDAAAADLATDLHPLAPPDTADELTRLRHQYVTHQLASLRARVAILRGTKMSFDRESKALYDAVAPRRDEETLQQALAALDRKVPGSGPLLDRYEAFRTRFVVPPSRLEATFKAAIDGCRSRTREHIRLPQSESFSVEYVAKKSWSAYNWYQGDFRSVIQINTDLPVHVDRIVTLACHEGYPGHHAYNVLLEKHFVRDRGWPEFYVYPLFSPQSLIAEGTADYGVAVAFPPADRLSFAQTVIFPSAGLDPSTAELYFEVVDAARELSYAVVEAARRYLDGEMDMAAAEAWLQKYALQSPQRAKQQLTFVDQYRSYIINYTSGEDIVAQWIESQGGTVTNPERRWKVFEELISSPRLPSAIATSSSQLSAPNDTETANVQSDAGRSRPSGRPSP